MTAIRTPPRAGPRTLENATPAWRSDCVSPTRPSSSPTISGTITRCAVACGTMKIPTAKTSPTRPANESTPSRYSVGISASRNARAASQTSIVRRAPIRVVAAPLARPKNAIGAISAATTRDVFAGDPVVVSDEPRQHDVRHLRAGDRDRLGEDERADPGVAEDGLHAGARRCAALNRSPAAAKSRTSSVSSATITATVGSTPNRSSAGPVQTSTTGPSTAVAVITVA